MDGVREYRGNELAMEKDHVNLSILVSSWRIQENVRHSIPWMCDKSRNYWAGVIQIGNGCEENKIIMHEEQFFVNDVSCLFETYPDDWSGYQGQSQPGEQPAHGLVSIVS